MDKEPSINWEAYGAIQLKCKNLAFHKNREYGTYPLMYMGKSGFVTRIMDKCYRLVNLYKKQESLFILKNPKLIESEVDTLLDIINYSIYYILYLKDHLIKENENTDEDKK